MIDDSREPFHTEKPGGEDKSTDKPKQATTASPPFNPKDPQSLSTHLEEREGALFKLNALAEAHSLRAYGRLDSNEHQEALGQWSNQMSEWSKQMDQIDPKLFSQIRTVARYLSTSSADIHQEPDQEIDWIAFYNNLHKNPGMGQVEAFVAKLKTMPGIGENAKGMEELSRMFGTEVHDRLFGIETQEEEYENRTKRSEEAVKKAFGAGKIDEEKKDRLLNKIYERDKIDESDEIDEPGKIEQRNKKVDLLINSIETDSKFTIEEKKQIQEMLYNIPPELLRNIAKVYQLKEDHIGAGLHKATIFGRASEIGLRSSALKYSEKYAERGLDRSETEGIFYHEILGHALRHYVAKASRELNQQMIDLLTRVPNNLLIKDIYANRYVDNDPKFSHMNVPRDGIPAGVDEFWADRMAEWWGKRNGQAVSLNRTADNPFSEAEQMFVDGVCGQVFEIYERAVAHKKKKSTTK